jgi:hypothetical protein
MNADEPKNGSWPQKAQNSQRRNSILTPKRLSPVGEAI